MKSFRKKSKSYKKRAKTKKLSRKYTMRRGGRKL